MQYRFAVNFGTLGTERKVSTNQKEADSPQNWFITPYVEYNCAIHLKVHIGTMNTVCPRRLDPFYIEYYMNRVTVSWTHSTIICGLNTMSALV